MLIVVMLMVFGLNFDFIDALMEGDNIAILSFAVTDSHINIAESMINSVCKSTATKALADMVITIKNFNNKIMFFSASDDYNFEAAPSMSTHIIFIGKRWKKINFILYLS